MHPTWKVLCDSCKIRYTQQTIASPPVICGYCGSNDILIGKVEENNTKEEEKKYSWECCRDHGPEECKIKCCAYCATIQTGLIG